MATVEERIKVLKLIEDGKVTAEEGARLLAALDKSRQRRGKHGARTSPPPAETNGRWVRVRVSNLESGKTHVNMTLPVGLVNMGLAVGARFVPDIKTMDVGQFQDLVRSGMEGKILEVKSEAGELVEIFVE